MGVGQGQQRAATPLGAHAPLQEYGSIRQAPPLFAHSVCTAWGYAFKANLAEAARPLHEYPTLKDFFTRQLKDGARPIDAGGMVSPCDSKIITFGEVTGERVEHIKGITYANHTYRLVARRWWRP